MPPRFRCAYGRRWSWSGHPELPRISLRICGERPGDGRLAAVDLPVPVPVAGDLVGLSAREREVLLLLGEHLTHEQIGQRLFISVRTVESHVASLRRKLGMADHRSLV